MNRYVAGFLFSPDESQVVLVRKNRPLYQAGLLNGVGGRIEPWETEYDAMRREFVEETGLYIHDWTLFCHLTGTDFEVFFFRAVDRGYGLVRTMETEEIEIHFINHLENEHTMPNLRWLIPMAKFGVSHDWPYGVREKSL